MRRNIVSIFLNILKIFISIYRKDEGNRVRKNLVMISQKIGLETRLSKTVKLITRDVTA